MGAVCVGRRAILSERGGVDDALSGGSIGPFRTRFPQLHRAAAGYGALALINSSLPPVYVKIFILDRTYKKPTPWFTLNQLRLTLSCAVYCNDICKLLGVVCSRSFLKGRRSTTGRRGKGKS